MDTPDIINNLVSLVTDKERSPLFRIGVLLSMFLIIFTINDVIGFTYYYNTSHKLESIEKIESLLKNDSIDSQIRHDLVLIERDLIDHQDLWSRLWSSNSLAASSQISIMAQIMTGIKNNSIGGRNFGLHFLTTCGFLIAFVITAIVNVIFSNSLTSRIITNIIALIIITLIISLVLFWILLKVPIYNGHAIVNYFINLACQIFVFEIITRRISRAIKAKK